MFYNNGAQDVKLNVPLALPIDNVILQIFTRMFKKLGKLRNNKVLINIISH
jgi:hypothetical protein